MVLPARHQDLGAAPGAGSGYRAPVAAADGDVGPWI